VPGGPVIGLPEGDEARGVRRHPRAVQVLGHTLDPADARETDLGGTPSALGQHAGVGVDRNYLGKGGRELECHQAGATPHIEKEAAAIETQRVTEGRDDLGRVRRSAGEIVGRRLAEGPGARRHPGEPTSTATRSRATTTVPPKCWVASAAHSSSASGCGAGTRWVSTSVCTPARAAVRAASSTVEW
jgi:hypothetical protein